MYALPLTYRAERVVATTRLALHPTGHFPTMIAVLLAARTWKVHIYKIDYSKTLRGANAWAERLCGTLRARSTGRSVTAKADLLIESAATNVT